MAEHNQALPEVDLLDEFRNADLDGDGKINAVKSPAFESRLPDHVFGPHVHCPDNEQLNKSPVYAILPPPPPPPPPRNYLKKIFANGPRYLPTKPVPGPRPTTRPTYPLVGSFKALPCTPGVLALLSRPTTSPAAVSSESGSSLTTAQLSSTTESSSTTANPP